MTAVEKLMEAVRAGRAAEVPALLKPLDAAERKAVLGALKTLRSEVRAWDWKRWTEATRVRRALYVAGAGCHTGAAAAAAWLGGRDLLSWRSEDGVLALQVLMERDPAWLADVAHRLAAKRTVAENSYRLIHGLVVRSGCMVPETDGYVLGWTRHITDARLLDHLRNDPQTPVLVAHALSMSEAPERLAWPMGTDSATHWPTAIATLAAEGVLDRAEIVDACVSRLLCGGRQRDLRVQLEVLKLVEPNTVERRERVAEWVAMTADGPSTVAAYAQQILAELALRGELPGGALVEMTQGVLFRTEKKLLRAQLSLVNKVLTKDPGQAEQLLTVVADAFDHEFMEVQERALKVVGRHLPVVDEEVRRQLAGAAVLLSPAHREMAELVFGDALEVAEPLPYAEILPPVPEPQLLPAPAETVEELMEDVVALRRSEGAMEFERALDGLVRHAHQDRQKVAAAVQETFPDAHWRDIHFSRHPAYDHFMHGPRGLDAVLAALVGAVPQRRVSEGRQRELKASDCLHDALNSTRDARLWEVADLIGHGRLPLLLATPSRLTGGIDPLVLVERLRVYVRAGLEPAPADLAQALLRVRRDDPAAERAAEEAERLEGSAGPLLAAWLRTGTPLASTVRFHRRGENGSGRWWLVDRILVEVEQQPLVREKFPPVFHWLGGRLLPNARRCYHWEGVPEHWASALPADREFLAACLLASLASAVDGDSTRGVTEPLPLLAEAEGPVGRAMSLLLAFGLGCRDADDRLRAVDALLVLAARDDLDARQVGEELAWLLAEGSMKPNRLADAARTAAATGAYRTVWTVLSTALPSLLAVEKPIRGLGELLAVAADCAERCGASGELPGLDRVASGRGTSQLVTQAKRLRNALRQRTGQNPPQAA